MMNSCPDNQETISGNNSVLLVNLPTIGRFGVIMIDNSNLRVL